MEQVLTYKWTRHGGYQVNSKTDKRFSAFHAILPDGRSIEEHYQCDVKGYDIGGKNWRLGKGKPSLIKYQEDDLYLEYYKLWLVWYRANHDLVMEVAPIIREDYDGIIGDFFASSSINQARTLADYLNHLESNTEF